ncbi:MAG: hypothetical protein ACAH21_19135 [Ramlibacter sp.]|nr:hypothetical protein [Ramlibacter sp.]
MQFIRGLLRHAFTAVVALVLVFEEWGWEPLSALLGRLARLPVWARVERRIAALPPWGALALFALPGLALLPIKLLAVFLIGKGHALSGLVVLLAAKLVGTALLARLFTLTQPALMQLAWFARWYPRWKAWKDRLIAQVHSSRLWRTARVWKLRARQQWAAFQSNRPGSGPS